VIDLWQRGNADRWKPTHTIGIVTTCGTYERFIPQWAESVFRLTTKPDKIVIAAQNANAVKILIDDSPIHADIIQPDEPFQFGTYLNHAVSHCNTDWIVWLGIDDLFDPTALDDLPQLQSDVLIYAMEMEGKPWAGGNPNDCLKYNPVPCGSPFRRWLWEKRPFDPEIAPFEDWAFWISAVVQGAKFARSTRINFHYRRHGEQVEYDQEVNAARVREWAASL